MIIDVRKNLSKITKRNLSKMNVTKHVNVVMSYLQLENAMRKISLEKK